MSTDATPTDLPDPDAIDASAYHVVVGPVLQAVAEVAAKRGHPTLHDDLPVMLALVELVSQLADMYTEAYPASSASATLDNAPSSACVMVFREADLSSDDIEMCLRALGMAHRQIHEQNVIGDIRPTLAMAWSFLEDDDRDQARTRLQQCVATIAEAVDAFEAERG